MNKILAHFKFGHIALFFIFAFVFLINVLSPQELVEITNSGFEHYIEFYGWTKVGTATKILRSSKIKRTGFYACQFQDPTSSYDGRGIISSSVSVKGNQTYKIGGYFYVAQESSAVSVDVTKIRISLIWHLTDKTTQVVNYDDLIVNNFNTWELKFVTSTAPGEAVALQVGFYVKETKDCDNDVYLDDILSKEKIEKVETKDLVKVIGCNPFSPSAGETTHIQIFLRGYSESEASYFRALVKIFDVSGKEIATLKDGNMNKNPEIISWSGIGYYGGLTLVPIGVYIVYAELYNPSIGKKYVGRDVIVVGRKW